MSDLKTTAITVSCWNSSLLKTGFQQVLTCRKPFLSFCAGKTRFKYTKEGEPRQHVWPKWKADSVVQRNRRTKVNRNTKLPSVSLILFMSQIHSMYSYIRPFLYIWLKAATLLTKTVNAVRGPDRNKVSLKHFCKYFEHNTFFISIQTI